MSRSFVVGLAIVSAAAIGCESSTDEISPTAASRLDTAAGTPPITILTPSLATLTGTVQNLTATRALVATGSMDAGGLRVLVAGTSLSAEVNSGGQFTLNDVPTDFVLLSFQGPGVNAPLLVGRLQPGQRVHISVVINGDTARIESRSGDRDDNRRNVEVEVEGTLARLAGDCPLVRFVVGNTIVRTNTVTNTDGGCSDLRNGLAVEVRGRRQTDGSILANRIELEDDDDDDSDDDSDNRRRR